MLQIQTANLPQDQQRQLPLDFLANERAYLDMRDSLLPQFRGQWVAVNDGSVIAAGPMLADVMERASACAAHPYIARVGEEDTVVFRVRRAVFAYDQAYQPFPLPRLAATFWNHAETQSQPHADVIPDTGADVSVLPHTDCAAINLFSSPCMTGMAAESAAAALRLYSTGARSRSTGVAMPP